MFSKPKHQRKSKAGSVQIKLSNNRLQLVFSFGGKRHYLSLGLTDTPYNRKQAQDKAFEIERDIQYGEFDPNHLEKYKIGVSLTTIETAASIAPTQTVLSIWTSYFEHKRNQLKPKTIEKYENFTRLFSKVGDLPIAAALEVKTKLQEITTVDRVRDGLTYLNAATTWACKHKLITSMPYVGMAGEMPQPRYITDPKPNAFSQAEMDQIIAAFKTDQRRGMSYRPYAPFVEFLFRVGCRPSEAIGLIWANVSPDCGTILFAGALVQVKNRRVRTTTSKNNRTRSLSLSASTQKLLQSIRPENPDPKALVFPSPNGDSINYRNFSSRAWDKVVNPIKPDTTPYSCRDTFITLQLLKGVPTGVMDKVVNPIKPDTTPYSCRDTFITLQLLKGVPTGVIAKWCDTSVQIIERHYLDTLKLSQLRPID